MQTNDNIPIVRNITEKKSIKKTNYYIYIFQGDLDNVHWGNWKYEILVEVIKGTYRRVKRRLQMDGRRSKVFNIEMGIKLEPISLYSNDGYVNKK